MADLKAGARETAPLVLRLALGAIFVCAGAQKLGLLDPARSWDTTEASIAGFAGALAHFGLEPAKPLAWLVALTEFFGGAFVLLGFGTRIASLALAGVMVVAIVKVHGPNGFMGIPVEGGAVKPGYAENLMIIADALALALLGSGPFALDNLLGRFRKKDRG